MENKRIWDNKQKEQEFKLAIDKAYKSIYKVNKENWNDKIKEVRLLATIAKEKNNKAKEWAIKEAVSSFFQRTQIILLSNHYQ